MVTTNNNLRIEHSEFLLPLLIKRMRQDLQDDWFPDPLKYEDTLSVDELNKLFEEYNADHTKSYLPSPATLMNLPKANFTLRYSLETSIQDRLVYQAYAYELLNAFDSLVPSWVFSHRLNPEPDSKYIFIKGVQSWQKFEDAVRAEAEDINGIILFTDVLNYFENVTFNDLRLSLRRLTVASNLPNSEQLQLNRTIKLLIKLLKKWSPFKDRGLPQNRDASSLLGNMLLNKIDKHMRALGFRYFRYMDDIRIVCKTTAEAKEALKRLTIELRDIHLNLNSQKTKILSLVKAIKDNALHERDHDIEQVDALCKLRRREAILASIPTLLNTTKKYIRHNKTDARGFRACVERLRRFSSCESIRPYLQLNNITDKVIECVLKHPAPTDSYVRYLESVKLTRNQKNRLISIFLSDECRVYGWQRFYLWRLFSLIRLKDDKLKKEAKTILQIKGKDAEQAGACIYLASLYSKNEKIYIAKHYKLFNSIISQRHALIAIHQLDYKKYISRYVTHHVHTALRGTYKRLKARMNGKYITDSPKVKESDLYNDRDFFENAS